MQCFDLFGHAQRPADGHAGKADLLGNVIGVRGARDAARRGRELPRDKFQKRRFARAVVAHEGRFGACGDGEAEPLEQKLLVAIAIGYTAKDNTHMDND